MKNIAIIAGGNSSEHEVSMKSGKNIYNEIDETRYNKYLVVLKERDWHVEIGEEKFPVDKNDFSFTRNGEKILFDFAYITIHGVPGENGLLQGYLDMMGVPYGCCNVLASALTFDKHTCNTYLKSYGVNVADSVMLIRGMAYDVNEIINEVGLPCFVKPNAEGSSFGVTKVKEASAIQPHQRQNDEGRYRHRFNDCHRRGQQLPKPRFPRGKGGAEHRQNRGEQKAAEDSGSGAAHRFPERGGAGKLPQTL